ncbi:MAG: hypothetical protein JXB29_08605 [Sedimentisphaerales bacterium]|nr:hypothetical protein [Sedimentisphaerales bacterium]
MDYSNILYGVLGYLGKAVIVIGAFYAGRHMETNNQPKWFNYLTVWGLVALLSLGAWSSYGTHTEDADPLYGCGDTFIDFEPTDKERNEYGLTLFFSLSIPALYGVYKKQQET